MLKCGTVRSHGDKFQDHSEGAHFRPPGPVRFTACPAARLLRAGRGGHGQGRADGSGGRHCGGGVGGQHGEGPREGQGEAVRRRRGGRGGRVHSGREGQQGRGEGRHAGGHAARRGHPQGGIRVGERGREQRGAVGRRRPVGGGGEAAGRGLRGVQSAGLQQGCGQVVEGRRPVVRVQRVVVVGQRGGHGRRLPLRGARAEVRDQPHAQRVRRVQAFHGAQVAGHLGQALAEPDAHEVHGQRVRVEVA